MTTLDKELVAAKKKAADAEKRADEVVKELVAAKKKAADAEMEAEKQAEKAAAERSPRYRAETASDEYNGTTCGVAFRNGVANFDKVTLDKELGYTLDQVIMKMIDMKYKVFEIDDEGNPVK